MSSQWTTTQRSPDESKPETTSLTSIAEPALRTVGKYGVILFIAGFLLIVPVSVILVGWRVLRQAPLEEAMLIGGVLLVWTIGYWFLVWWSDTSGLATWNETGEAKLTESATNDWDDEE